MAGNMAQKGYSDELHGQLPDPMSNSFVGI
jgi:hypothetical protein